MARPGATFLEDALVAVIFRKQKPWNSSIPSQVWAREYWNVEDWLRKNLIY